MARKSSSRLVEEYLDYCKRERGRTPQTIYKYGLSLRSLLRHLAGTNVCDATTADLRAWVHAPKEKRGAGLPAAPATIKRKVMELRGFYKWLHRVEGLVLTDPSARLSAPTVHNENPNPVPDDVWKTLWRSTLTDSDRVAFGLGLFCGLRRSEVAALGPHHLVDVPRPAIAGFRRKGGKVGNTPWLSCLQMHEQHRPDLLVRLELFTEPLARLRHDRANKGLLLDWKDGIVPSRPSGIPSGVVDPYHFNRHLRRALEACELPATAATPHMLRHGFGTNMLRMGVPLLNVSRLMGHSSVTVTQRYLQTTDDPLEGLLEPAVPAAWG